MGWTLPLTLSSGDESPRSYLCDPAIAYADYALEEARLIGAGGPDAGACGRNRGGAGPAPVGATLAARALVPLARPLLRMAALGRQAQINNWLLATNPCPPLTGSALDALARDLAREHPDRAVVVRSLNDAADGALIEGLRERGWALLPARQIYLLDAREATPPRRRDERRDAALARRSAYRIRSARSFTDKEWTRAAALYAMLYRQRYTPLNPDYTATYMREMSEAGILDVTGLQLAGLGGPDGLAGVSGLFRLGDSVTQPVVGYDTSADRRLGLYRMLMLGAMEHARREKRLYNLSAGAAAFKRNRGGRPAIEFTAVRDHHLPRPRRAATRTIAAILSRVGVPVMRRYGL